MDESSIVFTTEDGEKVEFSVIESAKLGGEDYLLVSETGSDSEDAYIMQAVHDEAGELVYEMVEDDDRLSVLSDLFNSLLDDIEIR